ncbi:MAG: hypothetical protein LBO78_00085, partial [Rickettsiales bacterium]|nr:hypothetical protein [Rickettsiales bacterium]
MMLSKEAAVAFEGFFDHISEKAQKINQAEFVKKVVTFTILYEVVMYIILSGHSSCKELAPRSFCNSDSRYFIGLIRKTKPADLYDLQAAVSAWYRPCGAA